MVKAKPIDRLALTRAKFGATMYGDAPASYRQVTGKLNPEHRQGFSTCPSCGQDTLIHEDGCMHCRNCGWSACG